MPVKYRIVIGAGILCLAFFAATVWAQQMKNPDGPSAPPKAAIDQKALALLKTMSDTLAGAQTRSFRVQSMIPFRKAPGPWVNLLGASKVVVQGKDRLFVETRGDFFPFDFFYDGKTITYFAPKQNFYAQKEAPGTLDEIVEKAYQEGDGSFVYADILLSDPYSVLSANLLGAFYVGKSTVGEIKTDHLAFSNPGVDWQIWIEEGTHLPRLVTATYLNRRGEPGYTVEFKDWKLNEVILDSTFTFQNTTKAAKIDYQNPFASKRRALSSEQTS